MKVDIHSHLLPSEYMKALSSRKAAPRIRVSRDGRMQMECGGGLVFPITERMTSTNAKIDEMRKAEVDRQVLSLPMPGVDWFNRDLAAKLAGTANDELAEVSRGGSQHFSAAATVPLRYPELAVRELNRAVDELGMHMAEIFSNVAGEPLDSEKYFTFYKEAARLGVTLLIHPGRPVMMESVRDYGLSGAVGFLFDTTIAILRLVYSGLLEKLPGLRIVLPHIGSTIPYLVGRIDHQYKLSAGGHGALPKLPSEYLRTVYIDTAQSLYKPAMQCALSFTPIDRILFGSDDPFVDLKQSVASVEALGLPRDQEDMIFAGNARSLGII